jgi:exonuclease VII small subunit
MSKSDLKKMESRLELIVAMTDIITDYDMPEQFEERLEEASDKLEEAMEKIGDAMEIMEEKAKVMKKALNTSKEDPTEKLAPIFKSMEKISDEMMRESDREKIMKKITEVVEKLEEMADVMENSDASKLDADKMEEQLDEIMRKIAIKAMGIANEAREEAKEESASKLAFNMLMIGLRIEDAWERIEEAIEGD